MVFLGLALLHLPTVSADDTESSAATLTDGVSSTGYVCDPDGCSPTDKRDFWKIQGKKGDIVQVSFSGSMVNPSLLCFWGDGWEGTFTMGSVSQNVDDNSPSATLSTTLSTAGEIILKVQGKDSYCNDGFDYTLTPSIDKTNRDTDEDGFIDTEDDCVELVGTSTNDRSGCTDSDGDGWSDPDNGWGVQNGADAFPSEASQWLDSDNDGYGDNLDGFQGDHCRFSRGYSSSDRYGCLDSDGDSYSDPDPGGLNGYEAWFAHPAGKGDAFAYEATQWNDTDEDGYGDNWGDPAQNATRVLWSIGVFVDNASMPDACPFIRGTSFSDRYGCVDTDLDSYSDGDENWTVENGSDAFPLEPTQWLDTDRDGWGDNQTVGAQRIDDFPFNPTQWRDTDRDGWGDNQTYGATQVDDFPFVPSQHRDSDGDGYGDNLTGLRAMFASNPRRKKSIQAGSVDSTDSAVAMWIETATPTQPICGLRIRTGLQTPSQTTLRSGLTPTGTASGITRNTTTDKRGARPIDLTAVERPLGRPRLIAGVAPMRTRTVGRTQHPHGSQARAARAMHGQRTQRSGTTPTVMDGGTIREARPPMFALRSPVRPSDRPPEATVVGARTRTAMAGPTSAMRSSMNRRSGGIPTATVSATAWWGTRAMRAPKPAGPRCSTDSVVETPTAMAGPIQPSRGRPTRSVWPTPSPPKPCSGRTPMRMDLAIFRLAPSGTTAPNNPGNLAATSRVAPMKTATDGPIPTEALPPPLPSWARTRQRRG